MNNKVMRRYLGCIALLLGFHPAGSGAFLTPAASARMARRAQLSLTSTSAWVNPNLPIIDAEIISKKTGIPTPDNSARRRTVLPIVDAEILEEGWGEGPRRQPKTHAEVPKSRRSTEKIWSSGPYEDPWGRARRQPKTHAEVPKTRRRTEKVQNELTKEKGWSTDAGPKERKRAEKVWNEVEKEIDSGGKPEDDPTDQVDTGLSSDEVEKLRRSLEEEWSSGSVATRNEAAVKSRTRKPTNPIATFIDNNVRSFVEKHLERKPTYSIATFVDTARGFVEKYSERLSIVAVASALVLMPSLLSASALSFYGRIAAVTTAFLLWRPLFSRVNTDR